MQRQLLVNPLFSLIRPSRYSTLRNNQKVDLWQPLNQLPRSLPYILHQRNVAFYKLVLGFSSVGLGKDAMSCWAAWRLRPTMMMWASPLRC